MGITLRRWRRAAFGVSLALMSVCLLTGCPPERQGWTDAEREYFYYTTQGSQLIRRDWFLALERHDSQDLFLADGLQRFGYLPGSAGGLNPDKLPIGFAVDVDRTTSREWIGLTCAACHTSDITFGGKSARVDGAPAAADLYEFLSKLDLALQKAANDDPASLRFAERVLGANNTPANRAALRDDADPDKGLRKFSGNFKGFVTDSTPKLPPDSRGTLPPPPMWGPARADAFGMIFNRVTSIDLNNPGNSRHPNAPVSYPFLWGTSWHNVTQWNGAVPNDGGLIIGPIHRLARNAGQVLGVFGRIDLTRPPPYSSSVKLENLLELERQVSKLTAPEWPQELGVPDPNLVPTGAGLYAKHCEGCHELVPKDDQYRSVRPRLVPASVTKTDIAMTHVPASRKADSGVLQGRALNPLLPGRPIGRDELVKDLLSHMVIGVISPIALKSPANLPKELFDASVFARNYKARPLNGIWATGPYLHNGSVRTLYQLLLPSSEAEARDLGLNPRDFPKFREAKFRVGSREFDPGEVGFRDIPGVIDFELDTTVPGNSNVGHPFGFRITDEKDRRALVEYLKKL